MDSDATPADGDKTGADARPAADTPRVIRAVLGLGIVGASTAQCLWMSAVDGLPGFVTSNSLASTERDRALAATLLGALIGIALGLRMWYARRQTDGIERTHRLTRLLAPLAVSGAIPAILALETWNNDLRVAISTAVLLLILEPLWRSHLQARIELAALYPDRVPLLERLRNATRQSLARGWYGRLVTTHGHLALVVLCAVGYAVFMGFYSIRNHYHFNTYNYDLGQIDNLFYNALSGNPMRSTPLIRGGNWSELQNHAEFSTYFLLPLYALAPRAETLLVMQAAIIGSGAIALYRFVARRLSAGTAALLAIAYLLYPPTHGANLFDIHFQPMAAAFVLWTIDMLDARRRWLFVFFLVVALGCREDISVVLATIGIFLVLTGHRQRLGAVMASISIAYFVVMRFVVMPSFGEWVFQNRYAGLFPDGEESYGGVIKTIITSPTYLLHTLLTPEKLLYTLQILTPLAFLPLRRSHLWPALLPGFLFTLMTTGTSNVSIQAQYSSYFVPLIFPGAALAIHSFGDSARGRVRQRAALLTLVVGTVLTTIHWGAIPTREFFRAGPGLARLEPVSAEERDKRRHLHELADMVPPAAVLAVTNRELPHLSNRTDCYALMAGFHGAEYIIYTPSTSRADGEMMRAAIASGMYAEIDSRPGITLFRLRRLEPQ